jgi:hypothetical protein
MQISKSYGIIWFSMISVRLFFGAGEYDNVQVGGPLFKHAHPVLEDVFEDSDEVWTT